MYEKYPIVLALAAFIFDSKKNILIVKKSSKEQVDPGLWVVPGGKVYPHEPILEALVREIKEEVGLEIASHTWIGEDVFVASKRYFHAQHFLCTVKKTEPVILENKLTDYAWMHIDDIEQYTFPFNLKKRMLNIYKYK
ncbi:MAG: NUDIX hydrolase [bacterium]